MAYAWGQERLGDQYKQKTEKNDGSYGPDKIISVANMYFKNEEAKSDEEYMKTYNVMRLGDIAFEGNKSKHFAHGRMVENTIGDGIVSHVFDVFEPIKPYDLLFWKYLINNERIMGKIMMRCTKASTMMTNLVAKDFLAETVSVPSIKEQKEIGRLLASIDSLISLHQRKLEKLQEIKKSLLQNMLPAEGEDRPKIRFGGYTDAWGQERLGDVADIVGGGTPSTNVPEYWDGDINWFAPAELAGQRFAFRSLRRITKAGLANSSAKMLPVGTVLFTSRAGIGTTAILTEEASTNQGFQSIVPHKDELDSYFVYSMTPKLKKYGETKGAGSTFVEVSGKQMSNMPIMLPKDFKEQQEIGKFFQGLDDLLSLHQRSPFLAQTSPANALMTRSMSLFSSSWMMWR